MNTDRYRFLRRCMFFGFIGGMIPDPILWWTRLLPFTWPISVIAMAVGMVFGESLVASGMTLYWIIQDRRAYRRFLRELRRPQ